jgi:hypothetical protein
MVATLKRTVASTFCNKGGPNNRLWDRLGTNNYGTHLSLLPVASALLLKIVSVRGSISHIFVVRPEPVGLPVQMLVLVASAQTVFR